MLFDLRIDQFAQMRLEAFVRPLLIRPHQTRIARHISGENGGQPAFDPSRGQSGAPQPQRSELIIASGNTPFKRSTMATQKTPREHPPSKERVHKGKTRS